MFAGNWLCLLHLLNLVCYVQSEVLCGIHRMEEYMDSMVLFSTVSQRTLGAAIAQLEMCFLIRNWH